MKSKFKNKTYETFSRAFCSFYITCLALSLHNRCLLLAYLRVWVTSTVSSSDILDLSELWHFKKYLRVTLYSLVKRWGNIEDKPFLILSNISIGNNSFVLTRTGTIFQVSEIILKFLVPPANEFF